MDNNESILEYFIRHSFGINVQEIKLVFTTSLCNCNTALCLTQ